MGLNDQTAQALEAEARAEIGLGHDLYGPELRAIAKCAACDAVVFGLSDHSWAIVHLTWSTSRPESPPWPQAARLGSFLAIELAMDQHEH
jgi:hypothetical protein